MTRIGRATRGKKAQEYQYEFKSVVSSMSFDIVGGDARVRDLRLDVVERPQITEMALWCEYPQYLRRSPRELSVSGAMKIPEGTRITIRGSANKDLEQVKISGMADSEAESLNMSLQTDRRAFEFQLPPLTEHQVLMFRLVDCDQIENLEPYRLAINIAPDEPPQVNIQLQGIGGAITPLARLPVTGTITDDYALDAAAFDYHIDEGETQTATIGRQGSRANEIEIDAALDLREFPENRRLQPKQRLNLSIRAPDFYNLGSSPQTGKSQRFVLQVVSPEQLQLLLQKRELELRRRYETIYTDMVDTRDLLARVDFRVSVEPSPRESPESDPAEGSTEDAGADQNPTES